MVHALLTCFLVLLVLVELSCRERGEEVEEGQAEGLGVTSQPVV